MSSDTEDRLSEAELIGLLLIARAPVVASYWEDRTIQRFRTLGLVECDGESIRLTEAGRQALAAHGPS